MRLLAIESSGARGGVALFDGDRLLGERLFEKGMVHGREIAPAIADLLRDAGWRPADLQLVAVDVGPGSYTGLRVGLAAAKGLCLAVGCAAATVTSVDALVEPFRDRPVVVAAVDAKWDQIYGAVYEAGRQIGPIVAEKPRDFARRVPANAVVVGDAVEKYGAILPGEHAAAEFRYPRPSVVGRLALRSGRREDPSKIVPLYLRPTEAELKFGAGPAANRE